MGELEDDEKESIHEKAEVDKEEVKGEGEVRDDEYLLKPSQILISP